MIKKMWSKEEVELLKASEPITREKLKELSNRLDRSVDAIERKLFRENIPFFGTKTTSDVPSSIDTPPPNKELVAQVERLEKQVEDLVGRRNIPRVAFEGDWIRFGYITDSHMGSLFERLDILEAAYDTFKREKIKEVFHSGDILDGEKMYKGHEYEIKIHGADAQAQHCIDHYPKRGGISTHFITGNHDLSFWKNAGVDVGEKVADKRSDMIYLGKELADVILSLGKQKVKIRLIHPRKGTAYALSYQPQKYIDSLSGGQKPHVVLMGHYHKAEELPCYRNVFLLQGGCVQSQTPHMQGNSLAAHMGFWIIEILINQKNLISRFKSEFVAFYEGTDPELEI